MRINCLDPRWCKFDFYYTSKDDFVAAPGRSYEQYICSTATRGDGRAVCSPVCSGMPARNIQRSINGTSIHGQNGNYGFHGGTDHLKLQQNQQKGACGNCKACTLLEPHQVTATVTNAAAAAGQRTRTRARTPSLPQDLALQMHAQR